MYTMVVQVQRQKMDLEILVGLTKKCFVCTCPSERELVCEQDWRPVWRACFVVCGTEGSSTGRDLGTFDGAK